MDVHHQEAEERAGNGKRCEWVRILLIWAMKMLVNMRPSDSQNTGRGRCGLSFGHVSMYSNI